VQLEIAFQKSNSAPELQNPCSVDGAEGLNTLVTWSTNKPDGWQMPAEHAASPDSDVQVSVYHDLKSLESTWREFQEKAAGTFYQTFDWCDAWFQTVGANEQVEPRIVVGRGKDQKLLFLLPFMVRRTKLANLLEWIGARQITYGYGLFDRAFLPRANAWFGSSGWRILRQIEGADAVRLGELPAELHGMPHPLSGWFTTVAANRSYTMELQPDFEGLHARKRSGESRRGSKKRDLALSKLGKLEFLLPASTEDAIACLDQMFDHQEERLAERGIRGIFGTRERAFVKELARRPHALLPYHLTLDGNLVAMMLGGQYDSTYWALVSSLCPGSLRKYSPGDAALRRTIAACCASGMRRFDFSSGDSDYKSTWADSLIPLWECIRILNFRGAVWAAGSLAFVTLKRLVKRSPILWSIFGHVRRLTRYVPPSSS
jgi:CelD/BcsL family acetyltransferase involved in cellulose biosynthesis